MTDRELIEAAGRAAGQERSHAGDLWSDPRGELWSPLTDDGDALRLAVKLHMSIDHNEPRDGESWVSVTIQRTGRPLIEAGEEVDGDIGRPHATRRAIVRAAAALDAGRMDGEKE